MPHVRATMTIPSSLGHLSCFCKSKLCTCFLLHLDYPSQLITRLTGKGLEEISLLVFFSSSKHGHQLLCPLCSHNSVLFCVLAFTGCHLCQLLVEVYFCIVFGFLFDCDLLVGWDYNNLEISVIYYSV